MFFKIRRLRTRLELVFTVLARDRKVPVRCTPGAHPVPAGRVRFCLRILGPRASGDFVLRRLRGGSPKTISKKAPAADALLPIIARQRGRRRFRSASARRKIQQSEPTRAVEPRPRPSAFLHGYTLAADVLRFRAASTSWWVAENISKRVQTRGCAFAYYSRAARPSAISLSKKIHPSEPARAVQPRPRPSAFLHVYTLAAGVLAISCCVDFVAARRNKIATRAGPCGARSCARRPLWCPLLRSSSLGPHGALLCPDVL